MAATENPSSDQLGESGPGSEKGEIMSDARELYMSYTTGWRDGASTQFIDEKFEHNGTTATTRSDLKAAYIDGFTDGQKARKAAGQAATRIFGYKPTILRAQ